MNLIEQLLSGQTVQPRQAPQQADALGQLMGFISQQAPQLPQMPAFEQGGGGSGGLGTILSLFQAYQGRKDDKTAANYLKSILGTKGQEKIPTPYKNAQNAIPGSGILGGNPLEIANLLTQSPDPAQQQKGLDILKFNAEQQLKASTDNSTPYFTPVETTDGVQAFNNRTGQFVAGTNPLTGKPFIKPNASPDLQYQLHNAQKAGSEAGTVREVETEDGKKKLIQGSPENNFGNLRPVGKNTGYQTFDTPEEGIKAINNQLNTYGKRGINTISDLMKIYSPAGDGANDPTKAAKNIAGFIGSGVTPSTKVDFTNPVVQHMVSAGLMRQEGNIRNVFGQSSAEKKAIDTQAGLDLAAGKAQIENQQKQDQFKNDPVKIKAKNDVDSILNRLENHYNNLDKMDAIQNPDKSLSDNLKAGLISSDTGQFLANKAGSKIASERNSIESARSTIMPAIMQASGMTGSQINSDAELKQFYKSLTDPKTDIKSVKEQINALREKYGNGTKQEGKPETNVISYDSQGNRIR